MSQQPPLREAGAAASALCISGAVDPVTAAAASGCLQSFVP
ncbi:hypothetical protein ACFFRL_05675 [Agromyces hippuratus]